MTWFRQFPWLSLLLLLIVYSALGFDLGEQSPQLTRWLIAQGQLWGWAIDEKIAIKLLFAIGVLLALGFTLLLATPMALTKLFVGNSLKSDNQAILTFLGWSLAAVFFFRWISFFLQILVLVSATILARLDLYRLKLKDWQVFLVLLLICLGGFELGMLTFNYYHSSSEAHVG
jgi:hypothetical protein